MKKILLFLLISISGYSQTLLKLKGIEHAPGIGYCTITNSLGVQTYTPCSSLKPTLTLQDVVTVSNLVDGTFAASSDNASRFKANGSLGTEVEFNNGTNTGLLWLKNSSTTLQHSTLNVLDAPTTEITNDLQLDNLSANKLTYTDGSSVLKSVTLGSGLSLTSGTLSSSGGGGSTTTITAGSNMTVSGTAPNYTVSTPTQTTGLASLSSPTFTNANLTGSTTVTGTLTAPTPTSTSNNNSVATTSFVTRALATASSTLILMTANQANSGTTTNNTDLTELVYPIAANSKYLIKGMISFYASSTGGSKIGYNVPSGATIYGNIPNRIATNDTYRVSQFSGSGSTTSASVLNTASANPTTGVITWLLTVGATAGNLQLVFASGTNPQVTTVVAEGTYLEIIKLN